MHIGQCICTLRFKLVDSHKQIPMLSLESCIVKSTSNLWFNSKDATHLHMWQHTWIVHHELWQNNNEI
jgi:hypothetical protein